MGVPYARPIRDHGGASDEARITMKRLTLKLPAFGFIVATRAALGFGLGVLMSGKIQESRRRAVALTLIGVGAATTIPAIATIRRGLR